ALARPLLVFFFSSRRRHTRSKRDWSSDVCSSDLAVEVGDVQQLLEVVGGDVALLLETLQALLGALAGLVLRLLRAVLRAGGLRGRGGIRDRCLRVGAVGSSSGCVGGSLRGRRALGLDRLRGGAVLRDGFRRG